MSILATTTLRSFGVSTLCVAAATMLAAPSLAQTAPRHAPGPFEQLSVAAHAIDTPRPFATFSASAIALRDSVVRLAEAQIGTPYRFGGRSPKNGFDCSGLVQYVLAALNRDVPRTARKQATLGLAIMRDTNDLLPGDLLMFGKSKRRVSHVGIYIGHGRYVHASRGAGRVIESSLDRPFSPLIRMWRDARRVLVPGDTSTIAVAKNQSGPGGRSE